MYGICTCLVALEAVVFDICCVWCLMWNFCFFGYLVGLMLSLVCLLVVWLLFEFALVVCLW